MTNPTGPELAWQPPCPLCGSPSEKPIEAHERGAVTVHFICSEGHAWLAKWPEESAA